MAIAKVLEIESCLLYDDYLLFLSTGQSTQIKAIRKSLKLTQKAFAKKIGSTAKTIRDWELGRVQISKKLWERVIALNA